MATLSTLVLQLVAKVEPFTAGLAKAEERFAKFQKSIIGKGLTAGAIFSTLDRAADALGDELERVRKNGFNAADAMQRLGEGVVDVAKGIPVLGSLGNVLGELLANSVFDDLFGGPLAAERELVELAKERAAALEKSLAITKAMSTINSAILHAQDLLDLATATTDAERNAIKLQMELEGIREKWARVAEAARAAGVSGQEYIDLLARIAAGQAMEEEAAKVNAVREAHEKLNKTLDEQAEARRRLDEIMDEGERIRESVRTAEEIYGETIKRLTELLEAGAISQETFDRAAQKAKETLDQANKVEDKVAPNRRASDFQSPAALERRFGAGMPTGFAAAPELKTAKNTEQILFDSRRQTTIQNQQLTILKEIRDRQPEVFGGAN